MLNFLGEASCCRIQQLGGRFPSRQCHRNRSRCKRLSSTDNAAVGVSGISRTLRSLSFLQIQTIMTNSPPTLLIMVIIVKEC